MSVDLRRASYCGLHVRERRSEHPSSHVESIAYKANRTRFRTLDYIPRPTFSPVSIPLAGGISPAGDRKSKKGKQIGVHAGKVLVGSSFAVEADGAEPPPIESPCREAGQARSRAHGIRFSVGWGQKKVSKGTKSEYRNQQAFNCKDRQGLSVIGQGQSKNGSMRKRLRAP
jgi:hypothetical protein